MQKSRELVEMKNIWWTQSVQSTLIIHANNRCMSSRLCHIVTCQISVLHNLFVIIVIYYIIYNNYEAINNKAVLNIVKIIIKKKIMPHIFHVCTTLDTFVSACALNLHYPQVLSWYFFFCKIRLNFRTNKQNSTHPPILCFCS